MKRVSADKAVAGKKIGHGYASRGTYREDFVRAVAHAVQKDRASARGGLAQVFPKVLRWQRDGHDDLLSWSSECGVAEPHSALLPVELHEKP